jgi:hypothetical protein
VTNGDREHAQVERAEQTHKAVMEAMALQKPGVNTYTWRDRYLTLFQVLWDKAQTQKPE